MLRSVSLKKTKEVGASKVVMHNTIQEPPHPQSMTSSQQAKGGPSSLQSFRPIMIPRPPLMKPNNTSVGSGQSWGAHSLFVQVWAADKVVGNLWRMHVVRHTLELLATVDDGWSEQERASGSWGTNRPEPTFPAAGKEEEAGSDTQKTRRE